jgi:hypothetical protein
MIPRHRLAFLLVGVAGLAACDRVPLMAPTGSTVTLSSSHTVLAPNETAEITATVLEVSGTPVQNGTLVLFTTTVGQLDLREVRTHNGLATVRLMAGGASGIATISAASGGATSSAEEGTRLTIAIGAAAAESVTLTAEPATIPPTGGTVTLVANVSDVNGRGLAGITVSFSTNAGTLSPTSAVTDADGNARASLTTFANAMVTARAGTKVSTPALTITTRPATTLAIIASPANPAEGTTIVFTVTPSSGAVLRDARLDFGDGNSVLFGAMTAPVMASHAYASDGTFIVRATAIDAFGDPVVGTLPIVITALPPFNVTIDVIDPPTGPPTTNTVTTFRAVVDPAATPVSSYQWNFDGVVETSTSDTRTHIYTSPGRKRVSVRVTTPDGRVGVAEVDICVDSCL